MEGGREEMTTILDYLGALENLRSSYKLHCINCENYNHGRMSHICLKGHNIITCSHNPDLNEGRTFPIDREPYIPFMDTYANNGCKDYKHQYRAYLPDYASLIEVEEPK